jgi:branched-chain amino acid transport system permease protein
MDSTIASILLLDGLTSGAVYALLGLATVLVFTVTRVIFIPQGEFVAYGALTLAMLQSGKTPGTVWLLMCLAVVASVMELVERWRHHGNPVRALQSALKTLLIPAVVAVVSIWAAPQQFALWVQALLSVAIVTAFSLGLPSGVPVARSRHALGAADCVGGCAFRHDRSGSAVLWS